MNKNRLDDELELLEAMMHAEAVGACTSGKCGKEHTQLAHWLKELRHTRLQLEKANTTLNTIRYSLTAFDPPDMDTVWSALEDYNAN